jgi:hypothetical protein
MRLEKKMQKFLLFIILFLSSNNLVIAQVNVENFVKELGSSNYSISINAYFELTKFSSDDLVRKKLIQYSKNVFTRLIDNKKDFEGETYSSILDSLISMDSKDTLEALVPVSGFLGSKATKYILKYTNEAVPYIENAMNDERYYGKAFMLTKLLLDSTNIILSVTEKNSLGISIIKGVDNRSENYVRAWRSSFALRISENNNSINKDSLLKNIKIILTNDKMVEDSRYQESKNYIINDIQKIKNTDTKKRIKPIINESMKKWNNFKITLDEKKFKASLSKNLSAVKKTEMYNKRKTYLEGERQRVITELSNTLLELEKE